MFELAAIFFFLIALIAPIAIIGATLHRQGDRILAALKGPATVRQPKKAAPAQLRIAVRRPAQASRPTLPLRAAA